MNGSQGSRLGRNIERLQFPSRKGGNCRVSHQAKVSKPSNAQEFDRYSLRDDLTNDRWAERSLQDFESRRPGRAGDATPDRRSILTYRDFAGTDGRKSEFVVGTKPDAQSLLFLELWRCQSRRSSLRYIRFVAENRVMPFVEILNGGVR